MTKTKQKQRFITEAEIYKQNIHTLSTLKNWHDLAVHSSQAKKCNLYIYIYIRASMLTLPFYQHGSTEIKSF